MSFASGIGRVNIDLLYSGLPRLPHPGEELYSTGFSLQLGGGVPATLVNLSRLGVPVRILTWLGEDQFSSFAKNEFIRCGAEPINLYEGSGMPVNLTTAMLTPGERTFISYTDGIGSEDNLLQRAYDAMRGARVLEINPDGPIEVYRQLKKDGAVLVLDMGWDEEMCFEKYHDLLEIADYYTPNLPESLRITGEDTPERAARALERYFDRVIVKLDKGGCLIREEGRAHVIPCLSVPFADSTGAGDAFLSGLLYGLYHGASFSQSVLYGNITGGKCVTAIGCLSAYCTEDELLQTAAGHADFLPNW